MTDNTPDPTPVQKILVAELPEGREVTTYFVALDKEPATDRNGKSFLRLKLRDASGEVKAIHFDPDETVVDNLTSGDVVKVSGTYSVHEKFGQQFQIKRLAVMAPGEYDIGTLVPVSPVPLEELERRLAALVASVRSPSLHELLARAVDPSREPGATFLLVPAAVRNHHAYRHGLLEHSLIVAEVAAAVADRFATVNRDLTVAGALLHDIGKVDSYSADPMAPGFTDVGRLHGEIVIGHDIVRGLTDEIAGFPPEMSVQLRHIVVSHHGEREKGSPVVPATREAVIVHYCDDMTARLAAVDETAARTADGERWSRWVNMLDSYTYLAEAVDGPPVVTTVAADEPAAEDEPTADAEFGEVDAAADDAALDDDPAPEDELARDDEPEPSDDEPDPTSHDGRGEPTGAALF
jgi:3'-5' exoribonuclease